MRAPRPPTPPMHRSLRMHPSLSRWAPSQIQKAKIQKNATRRVDQKFAARPIAQNPKKRRPSRRPKFFTSPRATPGADRLAAPRRPTPATRSRVASFASRMVAARQRMTAVTSSATSTTTAAETTTETDAAAAEALRERLANSDAELTALTLALEEERARAEETLTLLAAAAEILHSDRRD